jgi:hypothetical protein
MNAILEFPDSTQLIAEPEPAPALSSSGVTRSRVTASLQVGQKTAQPTAVLDLHRPEDTRVFSMNDWRVCDEYLPAALILGQLRYWLTDINPVTGKNRATVHRDGHDWVWKSIPDWGKESGLGEKQVKRANEILLAKNLVVIEHRQHGFYKSATTEYRLTATAISMGGPHLQKDGVLSTPHLQKGGITENTKDTENTKVKILKPQSSASPLLAGTGASEMPQAEPGKPTSKPKKLTLGTNGDWGHYFELEKNHDMDTLRDACIDGGFVEPGRSLLTDTECSFLLRIEHDLKASTISDTLETFLSVIGKGWGDFCSVAEYVAAKELHAPLTMPLNRFDFVTKHAKKFFDFARNEEDAKAGLFGPPKPVATPPTSAEPPESPQADQVNTPVDAFDADDYASTMAAAGFSEFRMATPHDIVKYVAHEKDEAIKKAKEQAKKPKPYIHA